MSILDIVIKHPSEVRHLISHMGSNHHDHHHHHDEEESDLKNISS